MSTYRGFSSILVLVVVALLVLGAFMYFSYAPYLNTITREGWTKYEHGTWSIRHPAELIPKEGKLPNYIVFKNSMSEGSGSIGIYYAPLSDREPELQGFKDQELLTRILELQNKSLASTDGKIVLLRAELTNIGGVPAVRFDSIDNSIPENPALTKKTSFVRGEEIVDITLVSSGSSKEAKVLVAEYASMVGTFTFK